MVHLGQGRRGRNWAATDHTTSARFCSEPVMFYSSSSCLLADSRWMVIDDYLGGANKSERLRMQVDELVAAGRF